MTNLRVAIVQDYVANYRVQFFDALSARLRMSNIDLVVVAGAPKAAQAMRRDAASRKQWLRFAANRRIKLGNVDVPFYGTTRHWRDCDGVIFPLRGNSIDLNIGLAKKPFSNVRVGVWGHIGAYVKDANAVDATVERFQMRLCDHVFAYTPSGAHLAAKSGVAAGNLTTVMNSADVSEMMREHQILGSAEIEGFRIKHGLTEGKTFGYIGGIDEPKRIGHLVAAMDELWDKDPQIKFVVGGRGDQEHLLSEGMRRGQIIRLGYSGPKEKALIYCVSEAIVNPGRIGLLAVECMAMATPLLTSDWKYHGPEYEYLTEGEDVLVALGGPEALAELILNWTIDHGHKKPRKRDYPNLDAMVTNFTSGILKMMTPNS